jgi:hypothetical protein
MEAPKTLSRGFFDARAIFRYPFEGIDPEFFRPATDML